MLCGKDARFEWRCFKSGDNVDPIDIKKYTLECIFSEYYSQSKELNSNTRVIYFDEIGSGVKCRDMFGWTDIIYIEQIKLFGTIACSSVSIGGNNIIVSNNHRLMTVSPNNYKIGYNGNISYKSEYVNTNDIMEDMQFRYINDDNIISFDKAFVNNIELNGATLYKVATKSTNFNMENIHMCSEGFINNYN